jgi:hypothetical protein
VPGDSRAVHDVARNDEVSQQEEKKRADRTAHDDERILQLPPQRETTIE